MKLLEEEGQRSYQTMKLLNREEGCGPPRLGTNLKLSFDMYSMLFTTTIHPEYLYLIKNKINNREGIVKKLIDEQIEKIQAEA